MGIVNEDTSHLGEIVPAPLIEQLQNELANCNEQLLQTCLALANAQQRIAVQSVQLIYAKQELEDAVVNERGRIAFQMLQWSKLIRENTYANTTDS